jgi:hypothetical protein
MRYTYCQTLSPIAAVARFFQMYREEAEKAGYQASPDQLAWSNTIYVAETDQKAVREARPHLEALMNYFLKMPTEMLLPPGYTDAVSMKRVRAVHRGRHQERRRDGRQSQYGAREAGGISGSRRLRHLATKTQFGTLPDDMTRANMTAIADEVLPHFRDRAPQKASRVAAE